MQHIRTLLYRCEISSGEIVELQHRVVSHTKPVLETIQGHTRASPTVQVDKTRWREDGANGSIWSACTPTLRYDEDHRSRSGGSVKELIGPGFAGLFGSDFYAGDNSHQGLHQRGFGPFPARYPPSEEGPGSGGTPVLSPADQSPVGGGR